MDIRRAVPGDAEALARVHVACWRAAYAGLLPRPFLDELNLAVRLDQWRRHLADPARPAVDHVLASPEAGVVGFVTAGPSFGDVPGYDAEIFALYLVPAHQGRGWGRALLGAAARTLDHRGLRSAVIWALRDNPACGFYRRLGGVPVAHQFLHLERQTVPEVAYGWRNLAALSGRLHRPGPVPASRWPKRRPADRAAATRTPSASPPPGPPRAASGWTAR